MQDRSNYIANAWELPLSYINPSICIVKRYTPSEIVFLQRILVTLSQWNETCKLSQMTVISIPSAPLIPIPSAQTRSHKSIVIHSQRDFLEHIQKCALRSQYHYQAMILKSFQVIWVLA